MPPPQFGRPALRAAEKPTRNRPTHIASKRMAEIVRSPAVTRLPTESSRSVSPARSTTASPAAPTAIPWIFGPPSAAYRCTQPPSISVSPPALPYRGSPLLRPSRPRPNPSQFHLAPHHATTNPAPTYRETGPVSGRDRQSTLPSLTLRVYGTNLQLRTLARLMLPALFVSTPGMPPQGGIFSKSLPGGVFSVTNR